MREPLSEHHVDLTRDPSGSLDLLSEEATSWGGSWRREGQGGRLELPVLAGLRRGRVEGRITVAHTGAGSRLTFRVEKSRYRLEKTSVAVLAVAAFGALLFLLAPFVPRLLPAMPLGFLLTVAAWLFIVAGLRNSGPEEFFESLARDNGEAEE